MKPSFLTKQQREEQALARLSSKRKETEDKSKVDKKNTTILVPKLSTIASLIGD
jgi:hypothetical protein